MKVESWPLSSCAPRATMILRPSAWSAITGSNGGAMPQLQRVDRLHVVVAVEQRVRTIAAVAVGRRDDRGMAGGRPHLGVEAERGDVDREMIGRRPAIIGEGRIGGDRLDPQQREQPLQALVEIGIDAIEHGLQLRCLGHRFSSPL